jgi:heterotetrameric sarcosine oxidase gamma subunit
VIEALAIQPCAPDALLRLEQWGAVPAALPAPGRAADTPMGRLIWIEPGAWLLRAPLGDLVQATAQLEILAGDDGAVIDITGGLARFRLTGPAWRELLTVGGVFDVENPAFAPGCAAATILHHAAIWIDVIEAETADVYCLPSYAQELAAGWARAVRVSANRF